MAVMCDFFTRSFDVAFFKCLQTCKMPPTPSDVIEQLNSMAEALEATDEELWSEYTKALNKVEKQLGYLQYPLFGETAADAHKRIEAVYEGLLVVLVFILRFLIKSLFGI